MPHECINMVKGRWRALKEAIKLRSDQLPVMKTALTCAVLVISILGVQRTVQASEVETTTSSRYDRVYGNNPGLCGAWHRNKDHTDDVYNCMLGLLPQAVSSYWEGYRNNHSWTPLQFVGHMCNLTAVLPDDFYANYPTTTPPSDDEKSSLNPTDQAEPAPSPEFLAGTNCTEKITGFTAAAPSTPLSPRPVE